MRLKYYTIFVEKRDSYAYDLNKARKTSIKDTSQAHSLFARVLHEEKKYKFKLEHR